MDDASQKLSRNFGLGMCLPPGVTPPAPPSGSLFSSATFDFPVISETVEGACADVVMQGDEIYYHFWGSFEGCDEAL